MSYLKDERRIELIFLRGFPYPWDFHLSSNSEYAGKDYDHFWFEKEAEHLKGEFIPD